MNWCELMWKSEKCISFTIWQWQFKKVATISCIVVPQLKKFKQHDRKPWLTLSLNRMKISKSNIHLYTLNRKLGYMLGDWFCFSWLIYLYCIHRGTLVVWVICIELITVNGGSPAVGSSYAARCIGYPRWKWTGLSP